MTKAKDAPQAGVELDARDREILAAALRKIRAGQRLNQAEDRVWRRYEQQQRERYGRAYLEGLPKRDYLHLAGVANKVILEQAAKLNLPWKPHDKYVDVGAMIAAFHRLIADNPKGFYRAANRAAMEEFFPDAAVDWQEECFKERAIELADKRKVRRGEMLDATAVAAILGRIADRFSGFVEVLGQRFGDAAQRMAQQYWEDQEKDVQLLIAADGDGGSSDDVPSK
jgi:hypothetical protein